MADFPTIRKPEYPLEFSTQQPEILVSRHRDGSEQRRWRGAGDKRTFRLVFGESLPLTKSECDAFLNHFLAQGGPLLSFQWLHPEWGTYIQVRYVEPPSVRHIGYSAYVLEIRLKEVAA